MKKVLFPNMAKTNGMDDTRLMLGPVSWRSFGALI